MKQTEYRGQFKKRYCQFCKEGVTHIDYKNVTLLKKYMTDRGKIKPSRVTGTCAQHQNDVSNAIKRAREMALVPYAVPIVSNRLDRRHR